MASGESFERMTVNLLKGKRSYTFEFTDADHYDLVRLMLCNMVEHGWTLRSAYMHTDYSDTRTVNRGELLGTTDAHNVSAIFEALVHDPENAGVIYSYGELFSWDAEYFENSRYGRPYQEGYQGVYALDSYAAEFAFDWYQGLNAIIPEGLIIDWKSTGEDLMDSFCDNEFGDEIYIFANH